MNINIRLAHISDTAVIVKFNSLMAKETENIELNQERLQRGVKAIFADPSKGEYYVAEADGNVIGQLMLTYEWSDWRNSTFWWIQSVYVLPEHRQKGIFKSLYKYIESLAKQRGDICGLRLYVEKENMRAQKTYEALEMKLSHYQMMEALFTSA